MKTAYLIVCLLLFAIHCKEKVDNQNSAGVPANEALILASYASFINHAWNRKDMDTLKAVSTVNYTRNLNGIQVAENQSEMEAMMKVYFKGFPDGRFTLGNAMVKDSHLVTRWTFRGTNTGIYGDKAPTGKRVEVSGFSEIVFDDSGKMIREDIFYNELELLQQLGYTLIPPNLE